MHKIYLSSLSTCSIKAKQPNVLEKSMYEKSISKSSIRICFSKSTTNQEVEYLIETLQKIPQELIRMD
jgi:cysteine sulfinate desulfinase/cysteine desulfurase-like protein